LAIEVFELEEEDFLERDVVFAEGKSVTCINLYLCWIYLEASVMPGTYVASCAAMGHPALPWVHLALYGLPDLLEA